MSNKLLNIFLVFVFLSQYIFAGGDASGLIEREKFSFIKNESQELIDFSCDVVHLEEILGKSVSGISNENNIAWEGLQLSLAPKYEFDGQSKRYFKIPNSYLIKSVTVDNQFFSTIDGLTVGMSIEDVQRIYGDPYRENSSIWQYLHNEPEEVWNLLVYLQQDKVIKVKIIRGN